MNISICNAKLRPAEYVKNIHCAGSEAYVAGLTYYDTSKEAVKRKLPNAVLITEELKQHFPCRNKSKKEK
ncbi:MAG: hypothetical protein LBG80_16030 [Bacteroidales bacterium]|jgi:hypothetical protein|nr:hypothetical protein [Bacteroidales bacterium]